MKIKSNFTISNDNKEIQDNDIKNLIMILSNSGYKLETKEDTKLNSQPIIYSTKLIFSKER